MDLPKQIIIGGMLYQVRTYPQTTGAEPYGQIRYGDLEILIADGHAQAVQRSTLLHECLHGLDVALKLELPERVIHALEHGLDALLCHNPGLVRLYLADGSGSL